MAVTRTHGWSDIQLRGIHVNTATAAYTLTRDDSGIFFLNQYTTNTIYTLPAIADSKGFIAFFMNANTTSTIAITSPTADTMVANDDATATTNTCAADCGSWALVIGDGTYYYCFEGSGTWTAT